MTNAHNRISKVSFYTEGKSDVAFVIGRYAGEYREFKGDLSFFFLCNRGRKKKKIRGCDLRLRACRFRKRDVYLDDY